MSVPLQNKVRLLKKLIAMDNGANKLGEFSLTNKVFQDKHLYGKHPL